MSSNLLNIGLSGLRAAQRGLATTGHNIANVGTPGFSRQEVLFDARAPQAGGDAFTGRGVEVTTIRRNVSEFINSELRTSTSSHAQSDTSLNLIRQIDDMLADPVGGLSPTIQRFFGALQDVSADPGSLPARQVLLHDADGLARRFHTLDGRLSEMRTSVEGQIGTIVGEINSLADGIADLNGRITRQQNAFNGRPPNDLLDQRDELLRELSARIDISVVTEGDGTLNVAVGNGQALVLGERPGTLTLEPSNVDPDRSEIIFNSGAATANITNLVRSGSLAGATAFRDGALAEAERGLQHIALGIATALNEQHALGQDLEGNPGGALFGALEQTAASIFGDTDNTGAPPPDISVRIRDVSTLPQSDFVLERIGATHQLTRTSDGTVFTLNNFPSASEVVQGMELNLASGTIADGDRFVIKPTENAASGISLALTRPEEVAAASPVRAEASFANTGTGSVRSIDVNSPSAPVSINFDTPPTTFDVIDESTGANLLSNVTFVPGAPLNVNGFSVTLGGAPAGGDTFRVANGVSEVGAGNAGTGTVGVVTVNSPDPNLTDPLTITFTSATTFDVTGATTGTPTTGVPFTAGQPISFNGFSLVLDGVPAAGDVFTVESNNGAIGDNRNLLAMAELQTTGTLNGGRSTFEDVYGGVVAGIGSLTVQAGIDAKSRSAVLEQVTNERDDLSGVNLDEEAGNLLRFQQAFQANAQLISAADEMFQAVLRAVD